MNTTHMQQLHLSGATKRQWKRVHAMYVRVGVSA